MANTDQDRMLGSRHVDECLRTMGEDWKEKVANAKKEKILSRRKGILTNCCHPCCQQQES